MKNRSEDTLEKRLVNRIAEMERQLRELTTKQPVDFSTVQIETIPATGYASTDPVTLSQNEFTYWTCGIVPDDPANMALPTLMNYELAVRVDVDDVFHQLPHVSGGNSGQRTTLVSTYHMGKGPDSLLVDNLGVVELVIWIQNLDINDHTYYVHSRGFTIRRGDLPTDLFLVNA